MGNDKFYPLAVQGFSQRRRGYLKSGRRGSRAAPRFNFVEAKVFR